MQMDMPDGNALKWQKHCDCGKQGSCCNCWEPGSFIIHSFEETKDSRTRVNDATYFIFDCAIVAETDTQTQVCLLH